MTRFIFVFLLLLSSPRLSTAEPSKSSSLIDQNQLVSQCNNGEISKCKIIFDYVERGLIDSQEVYAFAGLSACKAGDKDGCGIFLLNSEIRSLAYWEKIKPKLITSASTQVIEFVQIDNQTKNISEQPKSVEVDPQQVKTLMSAINDLPSPIKKLFRRRLVTIIPVKDLGSSAYSLSLFGPSGQVEAGLIMIDVDVFGRAANAWASWKENSAFIPDSKHRLSVTIENTAQDNQKNTIQYLLLHELGHIIESSGSFLPPPEERPVSSFIKKYPFLEISWMIENGRFQSKFLDPFEELKKVHFYTGPGKDKLSLGHAADIYKKLSKTNYPSLYASLDPREDFAESFAGYVHSQMMKRPYQVEITKEGKSVYKSPSFWDSPRSKRSTSSFRPTLSKSARLS